MKPILNLIRWKNLVIIALVQLLIKYALLVPFYESHGVLTSLSSGHFALLVIATLCIAAAGYIINDIYDLETDTINKPNKIIIGKHIKEQTAVYVFITLNCLGVGLGYYLSNYIGKSGYFPIFFCASALLYIYSSYFKQLMLIGNIIVALVVALSIMIVGIFELLPIIVPANKGIQTFFFNLVVDYACFAFIISLLRELVKDIEDTEGDYKAGMKTLPIILGRERATKLTFIASLIPLFAVVYYIINNLYQQQLLVGYFLIAIVAPLLYVSIKLFSAKQKKEYKHLSFVLKIIMLTGICSIGLYPFILK